MNKLNLILGVIIFFGCMGIIFIPEVFNIGFIIGVSIFLIFQGLSEENKKEIRK